MEVWLKWCCRRAKTAPRDEVLKDFNDAGFGAGSVVQTTDGMQSSCRRRVDSMDGVEMEHAFRE